MPARFFQPSFEEVWAAAGEKIVLMTDEEWLGMHESYFQEYDAIVIPDRTCGDDPTADIDFLTKSGVSMDVRDFFRPSS